MISTATVSATGGRKRSLALTALAVVLLFGAIDVLLRLTVPGTGILRKTVDIQTPATLYAKLEAMRRFDGLKVVVLGDSLIFGRTMRDHGDGNWEHNTLSAQLQRHLEQKYPGRPVMVSNLGMNGTLPTDLEHLVRIVAPLKPDLLVLDVSLRSFSRDFETDAERQTRPWLAQMSVTPQGAYAAAASDAGIDRKLQDIAVNYWQLYRLRDFVRALAFEGRPANLAADLRGALDNWLKTGKFEKPRADAGLDDLVLLMRASARYAGIDLEADNPQRQALDRTLERLKTTGQPALVFYATENPEVRPDLLPEARFEALQGELAAAIVPALSSKAAFVGPLPIFKPANFLDHVHLTAEGYRLLAAELGKRAEALIGPARSR